MVAERGLTIREEKTLKRDSLVIEELLDAECCEQFTLDQINCFEKAVKKMDDEMAQGLSLYEDMVRNFKVKFALLRKKQLAVQDAVNSAERHLSKEKLPSHDGQTGSFPSFWTIFKSIAD